MHMPGMKVIVPSTPRDGKGLLASAIFDEDPCLFVETIRLQAQKGSVPTDPGFRIPLGQADVKRPGSDVTLISYGRSVLESLAAAQTLEAAGHQRRGHRSAHAGTAGRGHHGRVRATHRARGGRARRRSVRGPRRRDRGRPSGRVLRATSPRRSSGSAARFVPTPAAPSLEAQIYPTAARVVEAVQTNVRQGGCRCLTSSFAFHGFRSPCRKPS